MVAGRQPVLRTIFHSPSMTNAFKVFVFYLQFLFAVPCCILLLL